MYNNLDGMSPNSLVFLLVSKIIRLRLTVTIGLIPIQAIPGLSSLTVDQLHSLLSSSAIKTFNLYWLG